VRGSFMAAEMDQQPDVLGALAARRHELGARIAAAVPDDLAGVVLVARGSSDFAAIYGRYIIEVACRRPVVLAAPSLHTLYEVATDYRGYLAIAVSQSGRTPEIVTVLERMKNNGARTVAVTNGPDSPLAELAEATIDLQAGTERAVPATKTFSASLLAFAVISHALGDVPWREDDLDNLGDQARAVLDDGEAARRVATQLRSAPGLISVGRGYLYPVALEAALKLKETTSMLADGYSAADLRHGPVAVVQRDFPVLAFSAPGPAERDMDELITLLRDEHGARVFQARPADGVDLPLPRDVPEALVAIPAAVRAQQVAYHLSMSKGLDPDRPPGLSKVTATT
jgi:glucosamine--fructose-6-phosphate aminotransferase (isomerizing)